MITCGRCGAAAGIGGYGNNFRIFETFTRDGQKLGIRTDLCDDCQKQLIDWLKDGGYMLRQDKALPVRSTAAELVDLRARMNALIEKLEAQNAH